MSVYGTMAAQAGLNAANGIISGFVNNIYAKEAAERNYKYNEMSAENADLRTRNLYNDLYSPKAKIEQLRQAGLSPSIMSEIAGTGGVGQTGAMGAGSAGQSYSDMAINTPDIAAIELQNAQARKLNAEADVLEGKNERGKTEINEIIAKTKNYRAIEQLNESQRIYQEIDNYIRDKTKELEIKTVEYKTEKMSHESELMFWTAFHEQIATNFDIETFDERIKTIDIKNNNIIQDTLLKQNQIKLNNAQIERINAEINKWQEEIKQEYCKILISAAQAKTYGNYVDNLKEFQQEQIKKLADRIEIEGENAKTAKWQVATTAVLQFQKNCIEGTTKLIDAIIPL